MASPAPPAPPGAPGAVGPEGAEEALGVAAAKGRQPPVSALSAFSHIPARREGPPELSYFHRVGKTGDVSTYDVIFNRSEGYNEKLHRCDREHASSRGLNINEEEMARPVAVLSSSEYGRRIHKPLEQPIREHVKIDRLQAELYRTNGVTCLMGKPPSSLEPF
ncbi:hypothetical protein Q9233_006687 [Columba guinea]|nr:hypothetical protein Q9233_006687 [Columba guinea]